MKIDVFCEVETANTSGPGHEYRLIKETLAQAEAADAAGFDCWWQVEHHGAVAMSYSSAPDVILSAIAQRTKRMRIGHSAVLAPHRFATRSASPSARRHWTSSAMAGSKWDSHDRQSRSGDCSKSTRTARVRSSKRRCGWSRRCGLQEAFSWDDDQFHIKNAPIIPKPLQKPHPPMWQAASSPESFTMAGHNGVGALGTTLLTPVDVIAALLGSYRDAIKDADPAGAFINNQAGVFTFVHCAETTKKAIENGAAEAAAWYVNTIVKFFELEQQLQRRSAEMEPADRAGAGTR